MAEDSNDRFAELKEALDYLHVNASQVSVAGPSANLLGSALAELEACHKALMPFARMYRWTHLCSRGDDSQVVWRKNWLTGERMSLAVDDFRLAAVAYYHHGVQPTDIEHAEERAAEAIAEEILDKLKRRQKKATE